MSRRILAAVLISTGVLPLLPAALGTTDAFGNLQERSPFGNPENKTVAGPPSDTPLEFRGVLEDKTGIIFSLFETTSRQSAWVELNKRTNGISIKSYDAATMTITVEYHERNLTLILKGGKLTARNTHPTEMPKKTALAAPNVDEAYHDKPFRVGHVAEEMAIRRAVRVQAAESNGATVTTPN